MSRACSVCARCAYGKAWVCGYGAWPTPPTTPARRGRAGRSRPVGGAAIRSLGMRHWWGRPARCWSRQGHWCFGGEGYRKVWTRLRFEGILTSKERVRCLMREHRLQASHRAGAVGGRGLKDHDGTIVPEAPNRIWGTDATQLRTREEGGGHGTRGHRPLRRGRSGYPRRPARGALRGPGAHSSGPLGTLRPAGQRCRRRLDPVARPRPAVHEPRLSKGNRLPGYRIESSPSFVRSPQGDGVAERFIRSPKEQLPWVRTFDTVEELRLALLDFKARFNRHWLLQWHGYMTPAEVRAQYQATKEAA